MAELQFLVPPKVPSLSADPSSPSAGDIYFNTSTNKLRVYNGSTWDEWSSGASSVERMQIRINNPGSFNTQGTGTSGASSQGGYQLDTGSSSAWIQGSQEPRSNFIDYSWNVSFVALVMLSLPGSDFDAYFGVGDYSNPGSSIDVGSKFFGFEFTRTASGGITTNAVSAGTGGTGLTKTSLSCTPTSSNRFVAVRGASDVKFYLNGSLVATHTTGLPTGTTSRPIDVWLTNKGVASRTQMHFDLQTSFDAR